MIFSASALGSPGICHDFAWSATKGVLATKQTGTVRGIRKAAVIVTPAKHTFHLGAWR